MRITIKDIAKTTGFSTATVSLVLNNKAGHISEKTQSQILQTASDLNYRPNRLAVGLIKKHTDTIGLIIPDIGNQFFSVLAKGVETKASTMGYSTFLCSTGDDPQRDIHYIEKMLEQNVDGIVIATSSNSSGPLANECYQLAKSYGCPIVFVDRHFSKTEALSVYTNHEHGGYIATRHLLELGHQKIGCITGYIGLDSSKQRFFGYIRALQEHGVDFDQALVAEGDYHIDSGYALIEGLVQKGVTAVFASNDLMAIGLYKRALELGLRVPEDLSVVGYDNITESYLPFFPLTTVNQNVNGIGAQATQTLVQMINNPDSPVANVVLEPSLVVRESTCPLPKHSGDAV